MAAKVFLVVSKADLSDPRENDHGPASVAFPLGGRVLAVFIDHEDAQLFADLMPTPAEVEERTLFYGQPPNRGFNK